MKIEVGKKYRTRDGLEVFGPMEAFDEGDDFSFEGVMEGYSSVCYFGSNGRFWGDEGKEDPWDLVEEVTDDRADNSSPAVVHGHDTPACHCDDDGKGCVGLETPVLEQRSKGLWSRLVSGLAAVSRVVRRLCGVSTVRDSDYYDLSSR